MGLFNRWIFRKFEEDYDGDLRNINESMVKYNYNIGICLLAGEVRDSIPL